ncbi:pyruvate kinase [Tanacetum coccineum]
MRQGWDPRYKIWVEHGEPAPPTPPPVIDNTRQPLMSDMTTLLNDLSYIPPNNEHNEPTQGDIVRQVTYTTQATRRLTDSIFNEMLEFFQNVFPISKGYKLPPSYYAIKKTFKTIGLGYESIHACEHDCCLFRGDNNKDLDFYPVCNTSSWKDNNTPGKKVPKKDVLRNFTRSIPRLQRLYKSSHTAKDMIWHATGKCTEPGKMQHPVDGGAWKKFNTKYPDFAKEPRNVRLGLAADGFNPFGNLSQAYSMWGDIGRNIQSASVDLKVLWDQKGVENIDVASGQKFNMRAWFYEPSKIFQLTVVLLGGVGKVTACPYIKSALHFDGGMTVESQIEWVDILCELELIYPPALFDIMVHLVIHLPIEALEGGPISPPVGMSFIRFDAQELKKVKWYVLHNSLEIDTYRSQFKSLFPNKDMQEEFPDWFGSQIRQRHVDNDQDPEVSTTSELFALANGPSWTPVSVNSCGSLTNSMVVHSRDERTHIKNSGICSPGPDGEMYYGQLQEIIKFKYLLFKVALFRVKWFDTSNKGRKVNKLVLRNNMTQISGIREALKMINTFS